ncbi:MAG TPA: PAS domain S-box protein [Methanocella sp.]|jgi:PAS domain S-box-containing protein
MQSEVTGSGDDGRTREDLIEELEMLRRETGTQRTLSGDRRLAGGRVQGLLAEVDALKKEIEALSSRSESQCVELNRQIDELRAMNEKLDASRNSLAESEGRYRAIGELIPYGIWTCGPDGAVEYFSRSFIDLTGMPMDKLKAFGWTEALPADDREKTIKDWKACVAKGGPWDYEYRIQGADGRFRTVLSRGLPVKDAQGNITSWAGINLDITDRKWAEEELRLSDRMFNVLVNANIIGIFISGSDGTIIEANDSYLDIVGYTRDDLKAGDINCNRMTPPEFRKLHRAKEGKLIEEGYMPPHEKEYVRKDGVRVPVLLGMGLLDQSSLARIGYVIDLTENKRRELLLKRYRLMFDTIHDLILFIGRDGRIVDANYAAVEVYGYSHNELLAMNISDLRVMGEETDILGKLEQCFKYGCQFEVVHRRKDDSTIVLDISTMGMMHGNEKVLVAIARDITDRKRSEELLRRKQRELETLLDTLPGNVVFKDTNSVYQMANKKACEALGIAKSFVAGHTDYDFYPRRMAEKFRADDWRAISSGKALYDMEEEVLHGGRPTTMITSKVPLKNDLGLVVGIIGLSMDITGRKRAEEALIKSTSSLAKAERIASLGNWDRDFRTGEYRWSDGHYAIFGYEVGECVPGHDTWRERVHPDDIDRVEKALDATILRDKPFKIDYRVVWPDGSVHHVYAESDRPIRDSAGNPQHMFGIVQDITGRKHTEDELRDRETELAEAQRVAHVGSWVWDIADDRSKWSDEAYRIMGLMPQQSVLSFEAMLDSIHPADREIVRRTIGDSIATGAAYDQEYRIVRADGTERIIRAQAKVVPGPDGKAYRMHGTMHDVTERRQWEEALKQAKAQVELYMDLMGHDINNMNQVALNSLEFARDAILSEGRLESSSLIFLDKPIETLHNSSVLIENVHKLRNLYLGRYKPETIDLGRLLAGVRDEYAGVPGRDTTLSLSAVPGCEVVANALLRDVFSNIVGNAIRHSAGPVKVRIALDRITAGDSDYFRVAIEDDGPGIPDWKKWLIFERLKQGQTNGKGFGLYMVKTLVHHFHGEVSVEDRVMGDHTKGSRFVVLLPAVDSAEQPAR